MWHYNPEDQQQYFHHHENLKSHKKTNNSTQVRFQVVMATRTKMTVFWNDMPNILVEVGSADGGSKHL
jgi:hypothetical protein